MLSFIYRLVFRYCLQGKPHYNELQGNLYITDEIRNFTQAQVTTGLWLHNGGLQEAQSTCQKFRNTVSLGIVLKGTMRNF